MQAGILDHINNDSITTEENEALKKLLTKYECIFVKGYGKTRVTTGKLIIRLKNSDKIVQRRPYRMAPIEKEKLRSIIDELLENKIIRGSKSPFASPVVLVKKNGDDRLVIDYR